MSREEIRLQDSLQAIEHGTPPEVVFSRLGDETDETTELIRIAQAIRTMSHPEPNAAAIQAARSRVLGSVQRPAQKPAVSRSTAAAQKTARRAPAWDFRAIFGPVLRTGLAFLVVAGLVWLGAGFYTAGPAAARAAIVLDANGLVEAGALGDPSGWSAVYSGGKINAEQTLHTGASSGATLVFADGSRVEVGPQTVVSLAALKGSWNGAINASLDLEQGSLVNDTVTDMHPNSHFQVNTPTAQAVSKGTHFNVTSAPDGVSRFSVSQGEVVVTDASGQITLEPGQAVVTKLGEKTQPPAFEFTLQGVLDSSEANGWSVDGRSLKVDERTWVDGSIQTGLTVNVQGRILADQTWVADVITPAQAQADHQTLFGNVDSMGDQIWVVGGQQILVENNTQFSRNIALNDPVRVDFIVVDGGAFLAVKILELHPQNSPARPQLGFSPSGQTEKSCTNFTQVTVVLVNHASQPGDLAEDIDLGYQIQAGAEYIQSIALTPITIDAMDPGASTPVIVTLVHTLAWDSARQGTKVRLNIFVADQADGTTGEPAHLNLLINRNCSDLDKTKTPPGQDKTKTPPGQDKNKEAPGQNKPADGGPCADAPSPEAQSLADQYGVSMSEINGWLCLGHTKSEVDLAYSLAQTYGTTPAAIFDMHASGLSWGQIKSDLAKPDKNNGTTNKKTQAP